MVVDYSAATTKSKELIPLKTRLFTYLAVAGCSMIVGAALLAQQQPAAEKPVAAQPAQPAQPAVDGAAVEHCRDRAGRLRRTTSTRSVIWQPRAAA